MSEQDQANMLEFESDQFAVGDRVTWACTMTLKPLTGVVEEVLGNCCRVLEDGYERTVIDRTRLTKIVPKE